MEHLDFYAVTATLTPVLVAAGLFGLAPAIRALPPGRVGWAAALLSLLGAATFTVSMMILGDLGFSDSAPARWLLFLALSVEFLLAASGFLSQAIGHSAASSRPADAAGE